MTEQKRMFYDYNILLTIVCIIAIYPSDNKFSTQVLVVQRLDSAIHRIKIYPVDNAIGLPYTYPLDSDLSGG